MEINYFPFKRYVSYDFSLEVINYVPEIITKKEMIIVQNFLQVFHTFTIEERCSILLLDKCDILIFLTFCDIDSNYAVSIICHKNNVAILIELKSFNWLPFISCLVEQFQREIKMRGTYFMSDESKMSELRKQSRMKSLLIS